LYPSSPLYGIWVYNVDMQIIVLGRETDLCLAEAEVIFGNVRKISDEIAEIQTDQIEDINSLGGAIKLARVAYAEVGSIAEVQIKIETLLQEANTGTKLNFGLSYYGKASINLSALGIKIKKSLQKIDLKPRLVLPKANNQLNAASVKHNKLLTKGLEILIIEDGSRYILATTYGVQDIDAYSKRDYEKPCRDRKVGMLPPKLSQIMINLTRPDRDTIIVDPFCGSGGLLMEASLMGLKSQGSDLQKDMVDCANKNSSWFAENFDNTASISIGIAEDALARDYPTSKYSIVTEGFLGRNFLSKPTKMLIKEQFPELKELYLGFFKHLLQQTTKPSKVCVCMPFWLPGDEIVRLNIIDDICNLGYTKSEFTSVRQSNLSYHREGQFTGRQIIIFETK